MRCSGYDLRDPRSTGSWTGNRSRAISVSPAQIASTSLGDQIHTVYLRDPDRVRRYATDDVEEVAGLAKILGGAHAFALAQMTPRRYERPRGCRCSYWSHRSSCSSAPISVRGEALPAHQPGDGTPYGGAALHLFATGVARRVVKADVASLYPLVDARIPDRSGA